MVRQSKTYSLGDTLCDDGNGLDLRALHQFHGGAVDTSRRGKVDYDIDVGVLGNGLVNLLVDGQQGLAGAPVHLADELAAKGVDDAGDRGRLSLANEVKVQHALDGAGLQAVDEASRLLGEESVRGERAERSAGSSKALDSVVGRQEILGTGHGDVYAMRARQKKKRGEEGKRAEMAG